MELLIERERKKKRKREARGERAEETKGSAREKFIFANKPQPRQRESSMRGNAAARIM